MLSVFGLDWGDFFPSSTQSSSLSSRWANKTRYSVVSFDWFGHFDVLSWSLWRCSSFVDYEVHADFALRKDDCKHDGPLICGCGCPPDMCIIRVFGRLKSQSTRYFLCKLNRSIKHIPSSDHSGSGNDKFPVRYCFAVLSTGSARTNQYIKNNLLIINNNIIEHC